MKMIIIYQNGTTAEAVILSKGDNSMRVAVKGCEDVVEFEHRNGFWISENLDPVLIRFEREQRKPVEIVSEADCICSKELAARLIHWLIVDDEHQARAPLGDFRTALQRESVSGAC